MPNCGFGAALQSSPRPLQVVGYFYHKWPFGRRTELYRVEVTRDQYDAVVKRIKRGPGSDKDKDRKLFFHFQPKGA